jgi:hypothetical protein
MRPRFEVTFALAATLVLCVTAGAAVVPAPGFAVRTFPTPTAVQGGVVREGNGLIVGQGTFGSGGESIIRLEGAAATTIAEGFSSLGGFDTRGSTLFVVDNCFGADFGCGNPTTGDTVYAIPNAFLRTSAVTAENSEFLPSGTFATPQDVHALPGTVLLVSDAVGVGAGRVAKVDGATVTNLITGLDFLGGLDDDGSTLYVANVDGTFAGSVRRYDLAGVAGTPLATGLSGSYGVAVAGPSVLVTGGFTNDFSSSTLVGFDAGGTPTEWAHGFSFSGDVFWDASRGTALVLDFGATAVAAVCADADGDGVCDADCAAPAAVDKPKLKLRRQNTAPGDDALTFSGRMTIPQSPALDPVTAGVRVAIDDADGRAVVDVVVPGGAYDAFTRTGWKVNGSGTTWTYRNPAGVVGITKVSVKTSSGTPGLVVFRVTGRNGAYDAAGTTLPLHGLFALGAAGQGGLATFAGPDRACALNATGATLVCK